jgi:hypothetical protein
MESIAESLRERELIDALALDRARRQSFSYVIDAMRDDLGKKARETVLLIDK